MYLSSMFIVKALLTLSVLSARFTSWSRCFLQSVLIRSCVADRCYTYISVAYKGGLGPHTHNRCCHLIPGKKKCHEEFSYTGFCLVGFFFINVNVYSQNCWQNF